MKAPYDNIESIKSSLKKITNSKLSLSRKKITEDDKKRILFEKIITLLELVNNRTNLIYKDFGIDLSTIEERFYEIIDNLLEYSFDKSTRDLIYFYCFSRIDEDGNLIPLKDVNGNDVYFENIQTLWHFIRNDKPTTETNKKK